jgi:hypothetical protein
MLKKMVDGVEVTCSPEEEAQIRTEWAANDAKRLATEYADKRRNEYGSWEQQLDLMYHQGFEGWKTFITAIKDKYPKPQ